MKCDKVYQTPELDEQSFRLLDQTTVLRSPDSPTGWVVSFRYVAPEKDFVGVVGDWMFSDVYSSSGWTTAGRWPHEWKAGDFQHKLPGILHTKQTDMSNVQAQEVKLDADSIGLDPDQFLLGMYEMEKDIETGIFSCTVPLPSGTFLYQFVIDIPENPLKATIITDPLNKPLEMLEGEQRHSVISIPYSDINGLENRSIELPYTGIAHGSIYFTEYSSKVPEIAEKQPLTVYLPFGYDARRKKPYPTLYLSHGGNGRHSDWVCQGVVHNILDHLIASGQLDPTVVVMMDNEVLKWNRSEKCIPNILDSLFPFIQGTYNVSADSSRRAFAGLSMGGILTLELLVKHPNMFGYYGIFSGGNVQNLSYPEALGVCPKVHLGFGTYECGFGQLQFKLQEELYNAGIPFTTSMVNGGHQWSVWRRNFEDFAERILWK